jgi:hypothetical protein
MLMVVEFLCVIVAGFGSDCLVRAVAAKGAPQEDSCLLGHGPPVR